jgi:hypothetical protein
LNSRPPVYETGALPTELLRHNVIHKIYKTIKYLIEMKKLTTLIAAGIFSLASAFAQEGKHIDDPYHFIPEGSKVYIYCLANINDVVWWDKNKDEIPQKSEVFVDLDCDNIPDSNINGLSVKMGKKEMDWFEYLLSCPPSIDYNKDGLWDRDESCTYDWKWDLEPLEN